MTTTVRCPFEDFAREFETVADTVAAKAPAVDRPVAERLRVLAETVRADCACHHPPATAASKDGPDD